MGINLYKKDCSFENEYEIIVNEFEIKQSVLNFNIALFKNDEEKEIIKKCKFDFLLEYEESDTLNCTVEDFIYCIIEDIKSRVTGTIKKYAKDNEFEVYFDKEFDKYLDYEFNYNYIFDWIKKFIKEYLENHEYRKYDEFGFITDFVKNYNRSYIK